MLRKIPLKRPEWSKRNFITEVLIPSLISKKKGTFPTVAPVFPEISEKEVCITWIGHASLLVQFKGVNVLIDPNWANWLIVVKRLKHAGVQIDHLPAIDLVLITHAHFDHLNRRSLKSVAAHQPIVVPSGVGSLVKDLGFKEVREMRWWETVEVTFTPAKHWGARILADRHRGYGGYVMSMNGRDIYHMGDTANFDGFGEIGERLHPEVAMVPIGAYQPPSFKDHHICPEEAVDAFIQLGAKTMIPMHWGTYRLSYEPMHEPPQRLMKAAAERGVLQKVSFLIEGMPRVF